MQNNIGRIMCVVFLALGTSCHVRSEDISQEVVQPETVQVAETNIEQDKRDTEPLINAEELKNAFIALPDPVTVQPQALSGAAQKELLQGAQEFVPGVVMKVGEFVALDGAIEFAAGPTDGLEVVACLKGGKNHESMIVLTTGNGELVKAACIAGLQLPDGVGAPEGVGLPPRGTPVRVHIRWQPDRLLRPGDWLEADMSTFVRDRLIDKPMPPLPFVYTGSRFSTLYVGSTDGKAVPVERFMLDQTKSVFVNYNEEDCLFASVLPLSWRDDLFEVNSSLGLLKKTPVHIIVRKTTLPLVFDMDTQGVLKQGDTVVDDAALIESLAASYKVEHGQLYAVGVRVSAETDRGCDVAARMRLLKAAAQAGVWVLPTFILDSTDKE